MSDQDQRMGDRRKENPMNAWERHGQSLLVSIAVILLAWVGLTVSDNSKANAVLQTEVQGLKGEVTKLQLAITADTAERYRISDAERDFRAVYKEIDRIRDDNTRFMAEQASRGPRIKALETQVEKILETIAEIRMQGDKGRK